MTLYTALIVKSFQRMVVYRGATLAGLATNFFFGLLRAYVFIEVFRAAGQDTIRGYTLQDAITYTALTQALIGPLFIWGWFDIARTIRTGEIVTHLTKPYDFFGFWMARDMGRAAFQLIFRGLPVLVVYPLIFDLSWPTHPGQLAAIALAVSLAIMISFAWRFLVNVSGFWLVDSLGFGRFAYMLMTLLSGFLVPVALFPGWLQAVAAATPMPAMVDTPIEVYLGIVQGRDLALAIGWQIVWLGVMIVIARAAFRLGVRRVVLQGG